MIGRFPRARRIARCHRRDRICHVSIYGRRACGDSWMYLGQAINCSLAAILEPNLYPKMQSIANVYEEAICRNAKRIEEDQSEGAEGPASFRRLDDWASWMRCTVTADRTREATAYTTMSPILSMLRRRRPQPPRSRASKAWYRQHATMMTAAPNSETAEGHHQPAKTKLVQ